MTTAYTLNNAAPLTDGEVAAFRALSRRLHDGGFAPDWVATLADDRLQKGALHVRRALHIQGEIASMAPARERGNLDAIDALDVQVRQREDEIREVARLAGVDLYA